MSSPRLSKNVGHLGNPTSTEDQFMRSSEKSNSESGVLSIGSLVSIIGDEEFFETLWNLTEEDENEVFTEDRYAELMDVYFTREVEHVPEEHRRLVVIDELNLGPVQSIATCVSSVEKCKEQGRYLNVGSRLVNARRKDRVSHRG